MIDTKTDKIIGTVLMIVVFLMLFYSVDQDALAQQQAEQAAEAEITQQIKDTNDNYIKIHKP